MLVVAISTRALFDFSEENTVFEREGVASYTKHQHDNEHIPLSQGVCFALVKKLLHLNNMSDKPIVEVILCSRNSADSGLRVFNSISHYQLPITRAIFSDGQPVHHYLKSYNADLFLSANSDDVKSTLALGIASATIISMPQQPFDEYDNSQLKIAFDADCVLFSDAIEKINQEQGLAAFSENEKKHAHIALPDGPFSPFIKKFSDIQSGLHDPSQIRTALVTARSAPAHERVIRTLRQWEVVIDESFFLGGHNKAAILSAFKPDIFFDDRFANCSQSSQHVATGHVPYGITNEETT